MTSGRLLKNLLWDDLPSRTKILEKCSYISLLFALVCFYIYTWIIFI
jgi:tellurite resistance protein TehA-like permease